MKDKKKIGLILSVLVIISLIAVTIGVTYAFFNYAKEGTKDNYITTGTITFLYTEVSEVGRGISIKDAYPISDSQGKLLTGEGNVFDFKITSNTMDESSIPYEVTARKKSDSTLDEKAVKLYLTKVDGTSEEEVLLANYNSLTQTDYVSVSKHTEKTIYTGKVPAGEEDYEQNFRLRMWIDSNIDFSPVKDENGNDTYPYNDKEFTVTVNVYANAKVVTDENFVPLVPTMTGPSTTSDSGVQVGTVSESSYYTRNRQGYMAFNGNVTTNSINNCWQGSSGKTTTGSYIRYASPTKDVIYKVKVGTWDDNSNGINKTWTAYIRGSNDGVNWNKISEPIALTVTKNVITYFEYDVYDNTPYQYYDLYFDAQDGDEAYIHMTYQYSCSIMFLQFYGIKGAE